jgi:hypothetical protein
MQSSSAAESGADTRWFSASAPPARCWFPIKPLKAGVESSCRHTITSLTSPRRFNAWTERIGIIQMVASTTFKPMYYRLDRRDQVKIQPVLHRWCQILKCPNKSTPMILLDRAPRNCTKHHLKPRSNSCTATIGSTRKRRRTTRVLRIGPHRTRGDYRTASFARLIPSSIESLMLQHTPFHFHVRFRNKNSTFAGRSASLLMNHGNQ